MKEQFVITEKEITDAFTKWDEDRRKNPESFMNPVTELLKFTSKQIAGKKAKYLLKLLREEK